MSWHYRPFKVIPKKVGKLKPEPYYCVKEYYVTPLGKGWSKEPEYPSGATKKELIHDLELMLNDVKKRRTKVIKESL